MIHLEHNFSKPVGQWDLGLCEESNEQVSMLRRMRFKIATKILLHEFNVHAEKMFHLTFKFESKNDEQTRISIIVNAIKNRDERDPAKTKTFVENQEEDALKNKKITVVVASSVVAAIVTPCSVAAAVVVPCSAAASTTSLASFATYF
nr:peptidase C48, SUMO/sentrin/Ubl1 [Tanacetum cinerariifolium]